MPRLHRWLYLAAVALPAMADALTLPASMALATARVRQVTSAGDVRSRRFSSMAMVSTGPSSFSSPSPHPFSSSSTPSSASPTQNSAAHSESRHAHGQHVLLDFADFFLEANAAAELTINAMRASVAEWGVREVHHKMVVLGEDGLSPPG